MKKIYKIIKAEEMQKLLWSGGSKVDIYTFPENATSDDDNFIFSIGSATVDVEKSNFTFFKNCNRIIMTLDNPLTLIHNQGNPIYLEAYEPHSFSGEDETISFGKVSDYNLLMDRDLCEGSMQVLLMTPGSKLYPSLTSGTKQNTVEVYYCCQGAVSVLFNDTAEILNEKDALIVSCDKSKSPAIINNTEEDCRLIKTKVSIKE